MCSSTETVGRFFMTEVCWDDGVFVPPADKGEARGCKELLNFSGPTWPSADVLKKLREAGLTGCGGGGDGRRKTQ